MGLLSATFLWSGRLVTNTVSDNVRPSKTKVPVSNNARPSGLKRFGKLTKLLANSSNQRW